MAMVKRLEKLIDQNMCMFIPLTGSRRVVAETSKSRALSSKIVLDINGIRVDTAQKTAGDRPFRHSPDKFLIFD